MVLASMDIVLTVPFAIYVIVANAERCVKPWISWDDTHRHFSRVIQVPRSIWGNDYRSAQVLEIFRWTLVLAAFLFLAWLKKLANITVSRIAGSPVVLAFQHIACVCSTMYQSRFVRSRVFSTPSPQKMKNNTGGVIATPRHRRNSSISLSSFETIDTPTILD
jgi:hypothetical protein